MDQQSRAAGPQRRVLQRIRHAEQRHDAVAGEILDRAALFPHRAGHQFIDRLDQRERAFLAEPLGDRGEADHVREQRRDLPSFAGWRPAPMASMTYRSRWRPLLCSEIGHSSVSQLSRILDSDAMPAMSQLA